MDGQKISHYTILEKLGEGGMGIVYKAHDTTLDRVIALKFLPSYLSSDAVEKERFYHEARAASALNHPNITTIHEISEFEGRLYLAMEFVEGKTLKRLVGEDPLPLRKVLDVAIQVCDGLTAAGEKGIVHRDIKSDNIMITPKGQVKIMDFGLAKVKGSTKLTRAGSTLGTAAYMSPEQAQGEDVDHRSDIFSFGVVLYELLTGKLPFRGEHHAALMYSLINEEPPPVARFNEQVTPELERIVAKALAKDKDERYQHIDDMLADLRRERKHLDYARSSYATAPVAAKPPAYADTPPAVAQAPPAPRPAPPGRFRTYLIAGGAVAAAAILVAIFNPFNFQITTQKSSAADSRQSLAVMYFESIPDPEDKDHTGEMLTNLLTTSLFQTKEIDVISRERLGDIQKEMGQSGAISSATASKIASRAGVSMMLIGTILQKQPALAITYRLVEVSSGKIVSTQRLSGYAPEKIFSLVDTLASLVKGDLHLAESPVAESKSIEKVTTSSPEAYRSFLEGVELNDRFYTSEARAAFKRAIELDPNFAMAYFYLGILNLGNQPGEQLEALRKAYALSDRTTERERITIRAIYATAIERDHAKAIGLLEEAVRKYPHELANYAALLNEHVTVGDFAKALAVADAGIRADSLDKNMWNTSAYTHAILGRKEEALAAAETYVHLAPAEANPYDSKGDIYAMFRMVDSAAAWWRKAIAFRSDFPSVEKLFDMAAVRRDFQAAERYLPGTIAAQHADDAIASLYGRAILAGFGGALDHARADIRKGYERAKAQNDEQMTLFGLQLLVTYDRATGDFSSMLKDAAELSGLMKKNPDTPLYGRPIVAFARFKTGDRAGAVKLMESVMTDAAGANFFNQVAARYGKGALLLEEGDVAGAGKEFEAMDASLPPNHAPLLYHGIWLAKAGRAREAREELSALALFSPTKYSLYDIDFIPYSLDATLGISSAWAHYWLGVLADREGDRPAAAREYGAFLDCWKNADFSSPELADARTRLAALRPTP